MKISHVIGGLEPGGTENLLRDLCLAHARAGVDVHVVSLTTPGEVGEDLLNAGIAVRSLGLKTDVLDLPRIVRLGAWLGEARPDVIQTWMYHANLIASLAAHLIRPGPLVWGLHHVLRTPMHGLRARTLQLARLGAALSRSVPSAIVCCGTSVMESHAVRGYDERKMVVIPNGIDINIFRPIEGAYRDLRLELGLHEMVPLVGMVARYHPIKDHTTFIRAAARLHQVRPDVHFVLCGSHADPQNAELGALVAAEDMTGCFHLLGLRHDLPRIYSALDVAALTSRSEAFPLVLCEALACGTPCVATDVGDCARILGDVGRVVPVGDSEAFAAAFLDILRLEVTERATISRRGRQRICSDHDIELTARRYLDLYRAIAHFAPPAA